MTYRAPLNDMLFTLHNSAGLTRAANAGWLGDFDLDLTGAVLEEAAKFAENQLAPINRDGDKVGAKFANGEVTTAPGWKDAYAAWVDAGWNALPGPEEWGGQGLPLALNFAASEMWSSANMAFGLCPLLTMGAIEAIEAHGSDALRQTYLPHLIAGRWTGTMLLTEPGAGSDVGALRTKAERAGDGTYRIFGSKIFITYGEHDLTDNIVHLVLARLPDAPPGTRGISLFLVPKFLVNADGSLGARNDIRAAGIEHKLGIHGSPTCTMALGDQGGAIGYLIGEENRGMSCMFTMMNQARLGVGIEGVAIAERATQQAIAYAHERKQGSASNGTANAPIIMHPDIKRMLLTMRALTGAARTICYATAVALDISHRAPDGATRKAGAVRAALLTPMAKAFSTDIGNEVTSLGVQVHGGMGFIEETGAAQYMRDARIATIYEGTNGIQAIDLVTRKLMPDGGEAMQALIGEMRETIGRVRASNDPAFGMTANRLAENVDALERASAWLLKTAGENIDLALAGATPYLRLASTALGGTMLASDALSATSSDGARRTALARFFAENVAVHAGSLEHTIVEGGEIVNAADILLAV